MRPGTYGVVSHAGGVFSAAIRLATRSRYSHAFIVVDGDRVVEAQPSGACYSPLAKYRDRPAHVVAWNDEETARMSWLDLDRIVQHAHTLVGTPYGFVDIAALGLMSLGLDANWLTKRAQSERTLICSQLVARSYLLGAGIDLGAGRPDATVTPADLADRITERVWLS